MHWLCAKAVTIEPDPALHDSVVIDASADHRSELDRLNLTGGTSAQIVGRSECALDDIDAPATLVVNMRVPANLPLDIDDSGQPDYTIGAVGGPLIARLRGVAHLRAEHLSALDIATSGRADATVGRLDGAGNIRASGATDFTIGGGTISSLELATSGRGTISIRSGSIASLVARMSGASDVQIDAIVTDANLRASGAGGIRVARITGKVTQRSSGASTISIGKAD
jgi:hypothetical protein